MTNNDILRRLRFIFDISDSKMIALCKSADLDVTRAEVSDWLKKDNDPDYKACVDETMATFLNGFINDRRGKRAGAQPVPDKRLNNNLIFTKLKIALNLKAEDVLEVLALTGLHISKHELSAFFRKPGHKHFRACKDQVLRNFLNGLQKKHRGDFLVEGEADSSQTTDAELTDNAKPKKPSVWSSSSKAD